MLEIPLLRGSCTGTFRKYRPAAESSSLETNVLHLNEYLWIRIKHQTSYCIDGSNIA